MARKETNILNRIMVALSETGAIHLFRNHGGAGYVVDRPVDGARWQTFGLMEGSGDIVGWTTITVTPEMVGRKLAVFTSIEVKTETGRLRKNQERWAASVREAGGFAGVARTVEEAWKIVTGKN